MTGFVIGSWLGAIPNVLLTIVFGLPPYAVLFAVCVTIVWLVVRRRRSPIP